VSNWGNPDKHLVIAQLGRNYEARPAFHSTLKAHRVFVSPEIAIANYETGFWIGQRHIAG